MVKQTAHFITSQQNNMLILIYGFVCFICVWEGEGGAAGSFFYLLTF